MAKGWESKSVEDQIEKFQEKAERKTNNQLTTAQIDARRRTDVLLLSRARVQKDLQGNQNQRYQDQLNRALTDIEAQISQLKDSL